MKSDEDIIKSLQLDNIFLNSSLEELEIELQNLLTSKQQVDRGNEQLFVRIEERETKIKEYDVLLAEKEKDTKSLNEIIEKCDYEFFNLEKDTVKYRSQRNLMTYFFIATLLVLILKLCS